MGEKMKAKSVTDLDSTADEDDAGLPLQPSVADDFDKKIHHLTRFACSRERERRERKSCRSLRG